MAIPTSSSRPPALAASVAASVAAIVGALGDGTDLSRVSSKSIAWASVPLTSAAIAASGAAFTQDRRFAAAAQRVTRLARCHADGQRNGGECYA